MRDAGVCAPLDSPSFAASLSRRAVTISRSTSASLSTPGSRAGRFGHR